MLAIETKDLRKEFGSLVAVNDVTLSVEEGQVVGVVGPNGAGKTTLLKLLATLIPATRGSGSVRGADLQRDYLTVRGHVAYLPDFFNLYNDLRLWECLDFFAHAHRVPPAEIDQRVRQALEYVELSHKSNDLISHLSRGMTQRLGVAALMVCDPSIYLLDEPASGLDPKARIQLRRVLKRLSQEGRTILISSHILSELDDLCSHIAIMDKGRLSVFGTVEEIERKTIGTSKLRILVLDDPEKARAILAEHLSIEPILDGNAITVETPIDPAADAQLNAHLVSNGIRIASFSREGADIEALFMAVTGGGDD